MGFLSGKKLLLLSSIIILLVAIPLTIYFVNQQQETRSRAAKSTVLSLCDSTKTTSCESAIATTVGQTFSLDVIANPGTNVISFVKIHLTYDPTKLEFNQTTGLVPNLLTPLTSPVYTSGSITAELSVGADSTKVIQVPTKIATITFKALVPASGTSNQVVFGNQVIVYANNETGDPNASYPNNLNVLSTTTPASITVAGGGGPTATPTPLSGTPTPTPTPSGPTATPVANLAPICTALNIDRAASGAAPYSVTFTAVGNDPNGTINKVTFNFGDGPVQNVTQNGGIGTNSVSTQMAHTYNNVGTYTASASLTDNANAVSAQSTDCTKTITVTAAGATQPVGSGEPIVVAPTATPTPTPTPLPPKVFTEQPGPNNTILGIGAIGTILTIIGGLLFLSL